MAVCQSCVFIPGCLYCPKSTFALTENEPKLHIGWSDRVEQARLKTFMTSVTFTLLFTLLCVSTTHYAIMSTWPNMLFNSTQCCQVASHLWYCWCTYCWSVSVCFCDCSVIVDTHAYSCVCRTLPNQGPWSRCVYLGPGVTILETFFWLSGIYICVWIYDCI